jgi:predicted ATP-grasp superfamily ATP-dependent carboligase
MTDSLEVSVAVINKQLEMITAEMKEAREARKANYAAQEKQNETLIRIEHRLEKVETWVTASSPTLMEFNALKMKVIGAGILGRALWITGGILIGVAAYATGLIQKFMGH